LTQGGDPLAFDIMALLEEARDWARGAGGWWWRAPAIAWGATMAWWTITERQSVNIVAALTFQVHEFGHVAFSLFGTFVTVLGGSLMQLLVPLGALLLMRRSKDFFGVAFAGTWLAQSLVDLGYYIGDSRALQRDYVSLGGEAGDANDGSETTGHDWQYLLQKTHLIQHDTQIAAVVRLLGEIVLISSLLLAGYLLVQMWRAAAADAPVVIPTGTSAAEAVRRATQVTKSAPGVGATPSGAKSEPGAPPPPRARIR
jgi:hypothetical protein